MNNLYGSVQNGLRTAQQSQLEQMNRIRDLQKTLGDTPDPLIAKQIEDEMKSITTTLTYLQGIEDLMVKMANLPQ